MISAVVMNYNGGDGVLRTINSIKKADEIIVVDDNSTDNSVQMIKSQFPNVKIIENKKTCWVAKCRNQAIDKASGDIILFIDCDVYLKEGFDNMVKNIEGVDIVSPHVYYESGVLQHPKKHGRRTNWSSACFMIRREVVDKIRFDEIYNFYFEDWDFFLRAKLLGFTSKYSSAVAIQCFKNEITNHELKLYFRVRNLLYYYLKFRNLSDVERRRFKDVFLELTGTFIICLLNYSWRKKMENPKLFTKKKDKMKITERSRAYLVYLFFKAILWNLKRKSMIKPVVF